VIITEHLKQYVRFKSWIAAGQFTGPYSFVHCSVLRHFLHCCCQLFREISASYAAGLMSNVL